MRIFYTGSDIEDLAARGVRQLEIGPGVALTDAARERAEELGIVLLTPDTGTTGRSAAPVRNAAAPETAQSGSLPSRPRGCQHLPFAGGANTGSPQRVNLGGGAMVDQLVQAVSALKKSRQDG